VYVTNCWVSLRWVIFCWMTWRGQKRFITSTPLERSDQIWRCRWRQATRSSEWWSRCRRRWSCPVSNSVKKITIVTYCKSMNSLIRCSWAGLSKVSSILMHFYDCNLQLKYALINTLQFRQDFAKLAPFRCIFTIITYCKSMNSLIRWSWAGLCKVSSILMYFYNRNLQLKYALVNL
jgi:hypothetical protein